MHINILLGWAVPFLADVFTRILHNILKKMIIIYAIMTCVSVYFVFLTSSLCNRDKTGIIKTGQWWKCVLSSKLFAHKLISGISESLIPSVDAADVSLCWTDHLSVVFRKVHNVSTMSAKNMFGYQNINGTRFSSFSSFPHSAEVNARQV